MTARFARKDVRRRNCSPDDEKRENRRNSFVNEKTDSAVFRRIAEVRVFRRMSLVDKPKKVQS